VGLGLFVVVARREFGRRVRRGVGGSCVVLPLSQLLGEEVGVVDDLALGTWWNSSESMRWDLSTLPFSRGVRGLMRTWSMPLSSRYQ
jgi:hypothetical protein